MSDCPECARLRDALVVIIRSLRVANEKRADGLPASAYSHRQEALSVAEMVCPQEAQQPSGYTPPQVALRKQAAREQAHWEEEA